LAVGPARLSSTWIAYHPEAAAEHVDASELRGGGVGPREVGSGGVREEVAVEQGRESQLEERGRG
jgi:hypothetical protein